MNSRKRVFALGGALLLGMAGLVQAETTASDADLKSEIAALKGRIAQLEGRQSENWLNERRAEEVKTLVREVLADADTRASLLATGLTAGHNGQNFFLSSEDNSFLLNVSGLMQVRYTWAHRHDAPGSTRTVIVDEEPVTVGIGGDDNEGGFSIARAQVQFDGHIGSPKINYALRLEADRNSENVIAQVAMVGYDVTDTLSISGGRFKGPFLREDIIGDGYQLAAERSLVSSAFGIGYVEGVEAVWNASDAIRATVAFTDGIRSGNQFGALGGGNDFASDSTNFSVTGRLDAKLAGDWKQYNNFSSWTNEEMAAFVGAAVQYDQAETGDQYVSSAGVRHVLAWTVDGSIKSGGFNAYAAGVGAYSKGDELGLLGAERTNNYGILAQAGYMVVPDKFEPFARYEWIRADRAIRSSEINAITAGFNYYIHRHAAKFTLDAVWVLDAHGSNDLLGASGANAGVLDDPAEHDITVRAQFQLLF